MAREIEQAAARYGRLLAYVEDYDAAHQTTIRPLVRNSWRAFLRQFPHDGFDWHAVRNAFYDEYCK